MDRRIGVFEAHPPWLLYKANIIKIHPPSRPRRFIIPQPGPVKQNRRNHKQQREKRGECVKRIVFSTQQVQKRVVLDQRQRYDKREKTQHALPVDGQRIPAEIPHPVGENIQEI